MSIATLAGFLLLAGAAAYVQTLTGFAFGLITMGGIGLSGLISLPDAAVLVSALTLTNAGQMLARGWRKVEWRLLALVLVGSLPCLLIGFALLNRLADDRADLLRLLLGLVVIASSLQLLSRTARRTTLSAPATFVAFGGLAGLMGGMFSTGGPPVVYHLHRQPLEPEPIRETLVALFAINAVIRIGLVEAADAWPPPSIWWGLAAIPVVSIATSAARRWPPPLSREVMRLLVVALLMLSGLALAAPAGSHLVSLAR